jgi:hypothetical protein
MKFKDTLAWLKAGFSARALFYLAIIGAIYFGVSLCFWIFVVVIWTKNGGAFGRLHPFSFVEALAIFALFIVVIVLSKKRLRLAFKLLLINLILCAASFSYDIGTHSYQIATRLSHRGDQYYYVSIGWREYYLNWWWYQRSYYDSDMFNKPAEQRKQSGCSLKD